MLHLHVHSQYSTLDGLSTVKEIVARAKELHAPAVAITDHASVSSMPEFIKEAKLAGVKPIVGCEFYFVENMEGEMKGKKRLHLCVWAKNWKGVLSIMRQLSLANRQFYHRPIITLEQALCFDNCMVGTACCFGVFSSDNYKDMAYSLHNVYRDDFYIEIMPHSVNIGDEGDLQQRANERGIQYAIEHGCNLLATNDSHYTVEADSKAHSVMMATQYNKKLAEYEPWPPVFFMRDMGEMFSAFMGLGYIAHPHAAEAMKNTISLAAKVNIEMPEFTVNLPRIHEDEGAVLVASCLEGWKKKLERKIGDQYAVYRKRLIYELGVIKGAGFIPYFLMVQDIINWARSKGIVVGPARGSSAGSLACYLMDITRVDPIKHGLYFERFLNPERTDLPDIDVDFQDDRRGEVLDYIVDRYGRENVGQISTYNQMAIKGAFRDVSRAYGIDHFRVNNLSRQLEEVDDFTKVPELAAFANSNPEVITYTKRLDGVIRGVSQHACGVIISSEPLENVCAIERRKEGVMVTCWDKDQCEAFGLVKVDILGLTTLSILNMALGLIKKHHGPDIILEEIPLDDPDVLKAFAAGDGNCIFQFESHGMQELLRGLNITGFGTLVACTALYRPGPLQAGLTDRYAKVSRGDEYPRYSIPELEPILGDTNSVIVYQEQIMRIFNELGGFTWAESDKMRKIMGKKLGEDEFNKHREHFVSGCVKNGILEDAASNLFNEMKGFAEYAFNKSHACAYTMVSVYSMYLKTQYPAIFLASYLSCVKSDDALLKGIQEARRLKVPVLSPDVNLSTDKYEYDTEGGIIAPLSVVKGVGGKAVEEIIKARGENPFISMDDFMERIYKRVVNKRVVENLILAGAFASLGIKEEDEETREKSEAELMPTFDSTPSLSLARPVEVNKEELERIHEEVDCFYEGKGKKPLFSVIGSSPVLMVVNSQMKNEKTLATARGTATIFPRLAAAGVDRKFVAYSSLVKTSLPDAKKAGAEDRGMGESWLRREIQALKPKLIYCCNADAINVFAPGEKISKLYGRVRYNKEFGCYVMMGPSPQYASFRPEEAGVQYEACMNKIKEMFGGESGRAS